MAVLERTKTAPLDVRPADVRPTEGFVFLRDLSDPGTLQIRRPTMIDCYDVRPGGLFFDPTTVLYSFHGQSGVVLPHESALWQVWLLEIDARVAISSPQPRSAVGRQIAEIQQITGFTDQQLAAAFPGGVSRETVNRWRNRPEPNLRPDNLYRLGILHDLARRLVEADIDARVWLHQPVASSEATPYNLICRGQLADVRLGVENVAAGAVPATDPMRTDAVARGWDAVIEEEEDDNDAEWSWEESGEDAD
jgi:hypothetical protein